MKKQEIKKKVEAAQSTETSRKTGTKVVRSDEIAQELGVGCGNRAPFGRRKKA